MFGFVLVVLEARRSLRCGDWLKRLGTGGRRTQLSTLYKNKGFPKNTRLLFISKPLFEIEPSGIRMKRRESSKDLSCSKWNVDLI